MPKGRKNRTQQVPLGDPGTLVFAHQKLDATLYPPKAQQCVGRPAHSILAKPPMLVQRDEEESDDSLTDASGNHDAEHKSETDPDLGVPTSNYRNVKVSGGRCAVARKVSADLNSDDEILVRMKQDGRTDKEIADTLKAAGRVNYNQKTIGSRWKRLRIALAARKDKELDAGFANWLVADDQGLLQAIDAADQVVQRMKREADEEKWDIVARKLKAAMPNTQYSKNACRDRFEALKNNTAIIPPELHDDPLQREAEIQEAKKRYEAQIAKKVADEAIELANQKAKAVIDRRLSSKAASKRRLSSRSSESSKNITVNVLSTPVSHSRRRGGSVQYNQENSSEEDIMEDMDADYRERPRDSSSEPPSTGHSLKNQPASSGQDQHRTNVVAIPPHITALSHRAQIASNADRPPVSIPSDKLKDINKMNRDELREEAKARGLTRDGIKAQLFATIKAARSGATDLKQSPILADPKVLELKKASKSRQQTSASREIRRRRRSYSSSEAEVGKRARVGATHLNKKRRVSISKDPSTEHRTLETRVHSTVCLPRNSDAPKDVDHVGVSDSLRGSCGSGSNTRGCAMHLSNFPADWTVQNIKDLFRAYAVTLVQELPTVGEYVVNCAGPNDVTSAISTYDGATIKRNKVRVAHDSPMLNQKPKVLHNSRNQSLTTPDFSGPSTLSVADGKSYGKAGPSYMGRRLLVSNVSPLLKAEDLRKIFVSSTQCTNISPGKFHLDFIDAIAANKVMMTFDGHKIFDHEIKLVKASATTSDTHPLQRQDEAREAQLSDHHRY